MKRFYIHAGSVNEWNQIWALCKSISKYEIHASAEMQKELNVYIRIVNSTYVPIQETQNQYSNEKLFVSLCQTAGVSQCFFPHHSFLL